MGFAIVCKVCGAVLLRSDEIIQPINVLHRLSFACPNCHCQLVLPNESVDSERLSVTPVKRPS